MVKSKGEIRSALIIGASSGIGAACALELANRGFHVGITGRRGDELEKIAVQNPNIKVRVKLDLCAAEESIKSTLDAINALGGVDLIIIAAGTGNENPKLDWEIESHTISVNISGFTAMATLAIEYFSQRGHGHLVGISSIAAIRGNGMAPSYGASKAYVSSYLRALRHKCAKQRLPILITEVQPGFVKTAMAKGDGVFWACSAQTAAKQIIDAIERDVEHVYVTGKWRLIAAFLRIIPDWLYHKL